MNHKYASLKLVSDNRIENRELLKEEILAKFQKTRSFDVDLVERFVGELNVSETASSFDSIATMKMRALVSESKFVQAYNVLTQTLRRDPCNLPLRLEYKYLMTVLTEKMAEISIENIGDPLIETIAELLHNEGELDIRSRFIWIKHNLAINNTKAALDKIISVLTLFPSMNGLEGIAKQLIDLQYDIRLEEFLTRSKPQIDVHFYAFQRSPAEILFLEKKYLRINSLIENYDQLEKANEELSAILGSSLQVGYVDVGLKDFYFQKAIVDSMQGRKMGAIAMLLQLVKMDPANIFYQSYLNQNLNDFQLEVLDKIEKNSFEGDFLKLFDFLRNVTLPSFRLVKYAALCYLRIGDEKIAKHLMNTLLAMNTKDQDYLIASLEVAIAAKDKKWQKEIFNIMEKVYADRPYHLRIAKILFPQNDPVN
jgi:hypothetical protein